LDGIRAIVKDGVVWSRSGKPLPNAGIQSMFRDSRLDSCDGELLVGDPTSSSAWNETSTVVMSADKRLPRNTTFYVFDMWHAGAMPFKERIAAAHAASGDWALVKAVPTAEIHTSEQLVVAHDLYADKGYEGLILRSPTGAYKQGRGTMGDQVLMKMKRFEDAEATVVGYGERLHNGNPAAVDVFGRTKRASHQSGMVGRGDLGFLECEDMMGARFELGTGFDDAQRAALWATKDALVGRTVTFKFQKRSPKGVPIFPVFKGFRSLEDM
jgi:DNA ligase-1